jgi:3-oxoacyl-[acyl-carrier-protein] synthase-3
MNAEITGWGRALPPAVLSNADLEKIMDTDNEWIVSRSGIKERRISHVETSDLAALAARRALAAAGKTGADVDLIILATCSPDTILPSAAALVQAKIEAPQAAAFDLNAACSGWVYGLVVGTNMIRGGTNKCVLVIGAEKLHNYLDYNDRTTAFLFGDGAGAVVLEPSTSDAGLLSSKLAIDGTICDLLAMPGVGTLGDPDHGTPENMSITMEGREIFRRAVTMMADSSSEVLQEAGMIVDDVDLVITHQANIRIIEATARRLGVPDEKVFVNIQNYGNTSSATVPIAISEAVEQGRIRPGSIILFTAFGSGISWGSALYRWGSRVEPLGVSDLELPANDKTALELLAPNFSFFGSPDV